jgi:hypothetical protein
MSFSGFAKAHLQSLTVRPLNQGNVGGSILSIPIFADRFGVLVSSAHLQILVGDEYQACH